MAIVLIEVPAPIIGFDFSYLKSTYVLAYVLFKYVKSKAIIGPGIFISTLTILPHGCCVPYVQNNVSLAMMGVFCAVSGVSICELAIFFSPKDKGFCHCTAYGAVLCGTLFTTCRK